MRLKGWLLYTLKQPDVTFSMVCELVDWINSSRTSYGTKHYSPVERENSAHAMPVEFL